MFRFVDASFRCGCDSVVISEASGFISFPKLRSGCDFAHFFGNAVQSFVCQGNMGKNKGVAKPTRGILNCNAKL